MVSYGLVQSVQSVKSEGPKESINDSDGKKSSSAPHTPSQSPTSKQVASLKSSATKNKIPLIYSNSPGNSPSAISRSPYSPSSKIATPLAINMNHMTSLSPSKALEIVSAEVSKRQENFQVLIQQKRSQANRISKDLQLHDQKMKESVNVALQEFEKLKLAEEKVKKEDHDRKEKQKAEEEKLKREMEEEKQRQKDKAQIEKNNREKKEKDVSISSKSLDIMMDKKEEAKAAPELLAVELKPEMQHTPPPQIVSETAFSIASQYLDRVNNIKTLIKPAMLSDSASANQIMKDKMLINRTVGQFTRSTKQLVPLVKKLAELFTNAKGRSPEQYELVMYLAAKKIVKQSEMEVSVKQDSAFPLAILSVNLSSKHPEFQEVLLGRMMKKCPYIVPMYPRKQPTESMKDYQKRLGYNVKNDPIETDIQYGERMCGIVSLYSAIIQTDIIPNSYGIEKGWTWLARILNMKPRKITPLLIHTFLVIAGHKLVATYQDQALKIIHVLHDNLIPSIPSAAVASTTKLILFLEETVKKTSSFPIHPGSKLEP